MDSSQCQWPYNDQSDRVGTTKTWYPDISLCYPSWLYISPAAVRCQCEQVIQECNQRPVGSVHA